MESSEKLDVECGWQVIKAYLPQIDHSPGVYRMLSVKDEVLYVGKARSLRKRVASYARPTGQNARIASMIAQTARMMFITTQTETEALLLEQNLIKQLKPRYNILLRDDKSFPNILIREDHEFPQILRHRGARKTKGRYFGPFASASAVSRTLHHLERAFMLRNCNDSYFKNRDRPCLQYQIKRCSAPCVGKISREDYVRSVREAERFLEGKTVAIQRELADEMAEAAKVMNYEKAASLRDRIAALTGIQSSQNVNPETVKDADIIAQWQEGGHSSIQVFFIRGHQNWGNHAFFPKINGDESASEILEAFIAQFYAQKEPPPQLIVTDMPSNSDLLEEALSEKRGSKVKILVPQRGEKLMLVSEALRNAKESLARRLSEKKTQLSHLKGFQEAFSMETLPQRIEVYDNSHIQGAHAVGVMIVAGVEGFQKSHYRKFNIKSADIADGDDFAMMEEVLRRRLSRLVKEDPSRESEMWPDVLLIDGGKGQLGRVASVLDELGIDDIVAIGVAKGEDRDSGKEEFYFVDKPKRALSRNDPVLHFVQRLRDEAHRFAIGTHRQKRSRAITTTAIDDIPGIGAARKRALLQHFGSAKAVTNASEKDLLAVEGISKAMAEKIFDFFHNEN